MVLLVFESILVTLLVPPQYLEFPDSPAAEYAFFALTVLISAYLTFLVYRNGKAVV